MVGLSSENKLLLFEAILFQFEEYLFKAVRHCKGRTDTLLQYNFSKQQRSHSRSLRDHSADYPKGWPQPTESLATQVDWPVELHK